MLFAEKYVIAIKKDNAITSYVINIIDNKYYKSAVQADMLKYYKKI